MGCCRELVNGYLRWDACYIYVTGINIICYYYSGSYTAKSPCTSPWSPPCLPSSGDRSGSYYSLTTSSALRSTAGLCSCCIRFYPTISASCILRLASALSSSNSWASPWTSSDIDERPWVYAPYSWLSRSPVSFWCFREYSSLNLMHTTLTSTLQSSSPGSYNLNDFKNNRTPEALLWTAALDKVADRLLQDCQVDAEDTLKNQPH